MNGAAPSTVFACWIGVKCYHHADLIETAQQSSRTGVFLELLETRGVYVHIAGDGKADAGNYEGGVPCITDAAFAVLWTKQFGDFNTAVTRIIERLGVQFLVDALCK